MAKSGLRHVRRFKFLFLLFRDLNIDSTCWKKKKKKIYPHESEKEELKKKIKKN